LWDTNDGTVYATGTHTGTNGAPALTDSGKTWTSGQWTNNNYVLINKTQGGTNWLWLASYIGNVPSNQVCGLIISNDVHTIGILPCKDVGNGFNYISWTNGDQYEIVRTIHALDRPGAGPGDLLTCAVYGNADTVTNSLGGLWPNQTTEPVYMWANNYNGSTNPVVDASPDLHAGADYFPNTAMPGYVPLVYPHPLVTP
jgi:hypothetical protein